MAAVYARAPDLGPPEAAAGLGSADKLESMALFVDFSSSLR